MKKELKFPNEFFWGSATSAEQTEPNGHNDHRGGKATTIWDQFFTEDKNRFFNQQYSQNNFYEKYPEDLQLAKDLKFNSLRISISWARLLPDGKNLNLEAVKFYKNIFKEMKKQNLTIFVNLFHFDLPLFLQDLGGWTNKKIVDYYDYYAKLTFNTFGDDVDYWFTFNEPIVSVECQYWYGLHYPAINNFRMGIISMWNMLVAHHRAVKSFRELNLKSEIGIILNVSPAIPRSNHPKDLEAAHFADLFQWIPFMDTIIKGTFPKDLIEELKTKKLWIEEYISVEDKKLFKTQTIDILGINYYAPSRVRALDYIPDWNGVVTPISHWFNSFNMVGKRMNIYRGWEIYPKAIYDILTFVKNDYQNIKTFISENGMGVATEQRFKVSGIIQDDYRIDFYKEHLYWIHKALEEGSNLIGYHTWSYIDSWSWMNAYKNRYGFIELDLETNKRIFKKSATFMQQLASTNILKVDDKTY